MTQLQQIKSILALLEEEKLIRSINRLDLFYDEPKFFKYVASLNYPLKYSDGITASEINASGFSFTSENEALLKCLVEAIERLTVYCFKKKDIILSTQAKLHQDTLPLIYFYGELQTINSTNNIGWIKGRNISQNSDSLIPAQLVYLNFAATFKESVLSAPITTGAAGGFSHEEILLSGIYEIIERDAFMTTYLNKIPVPRISLEKIKIEPFISINESCKRYNLKLHVFDTTNDLGIPSFMSIIVDETGLGPAVTVGLKSNFKIYDAIKGSIGEAISIRTWLRREIYQKKKNFFNIKPLSINTLKKRGLYWISKSMIKNLDFFLNSTTKIQNSWKINNRITIKEELENVKKILSDKGFDIYFADISLPLFKKLGYKIYKVIIPKCQPLYLDERRKEIRIPRLQAVAKHFGLKKYKMNPVPHPFL